MGRLPGNSFLLMQFEESSGVSEFANFALAPLELNLMKLMERLVKLARQAIAMQTERVQEAVRVDNIEVDSGLLIGRIGRAGEHLGFEERNAIEAPGGAGKFGDEVMLSGSGRFVLV